MNLFESIVAASAAVIAFTKLYEWVEDRIILWDRRRDDG